MKTGSVGAVLQWKTSAFFVFFFVTSTFAALLFVVVLLSEKSPIYSEQNFTFEQKKEEKALLNVSWNEIIQWLYIVNTATV